MSALLRSLSFVTISKQFKLLNLTTFKASTILFKQNKSVHNFNDQIEYFKSSRIEKSKLLEKGNF